MHDEGAGLVSVGGGGPPGMSRLGAEAQSRCEAAAATRGGGGTIAGQSRGGVEGHSSSAGGAVATHGHATRGGVAEGVDEALDEARPRAGSSRSRGGAAAGGGGESEVSRQSGCGGEGHAGSAAGSLASLEDATAGTAVAAAGGTAPPDEPRPWTAASTRCWARSAAWMRRQPYRRAVPGWGSTALELGRWRSRSARTYDGDGRGRRTRRASTELLEGHSTQGWALASRWRSRPIHARDGGSTSTGLAMGLCCLPPPPPCAGESIRQFTLGATGIPPGYTLRLGIKSGSQWRRSPSYRESAGAKRRPPSFRSPTSSRSCESTRKPLGRIHWDSVFAETTSFAAPPMKGGLCGKPREVNGFPHL